MTRFFAILVLVARAAPAQTLECATGWSDEVKVIPSEWINDGYCDCPLDGKDEPDTQACSGSDSWPGIRKLEESATPIFFDCPQQPNLKLPLSRVEDGICDCCDGAEEPEGVCTDNCEELLKEEREARAKLEKVFALGDIKRKSEQYAFKKLREEKLKEVEKLEQQVSSWQTDDISSQIETLKQGYMIQRIQTMKTLVNTHYGLLKGLENDELRAFIVHACQLAGEMSKEDTTTCAALRLAGLDMGITWDDDNFDLPDQMKVTDKFSQDVANLLFENAISTSPSWILGKRGGGRRRLMEEDDYDYDGDYSGDYDDHEDYDMDDESYPSTDHESYPSTDHGSGNKGKSKMAEVKGKEKEMVESVQALDFSKTRMAYLTRSKEINEEISEILDADNGDDDDDDDDGSDNETSEEKTETSEEKTETSEEETVPPVDPAAYTMVRANLRREEEIIMKGFQWAASARLFFSISPDNTDEEHDLLQLAIGTLYYGNLSAIQVWQILQRMLPEFRKPETSPETCASPWAGFCPPQTISRKEVSSYPPAYIVEAAESFCSKEANVAVEGICAAESQTIPLAIPHGYYGYYAALPRDDKDPLNSLFAPMDSLPVDKDKLESLEKELEESEKQKKDIEKTIRETWTDIGGREGDELGPNGELHPLADTCVELLVGKYTYEVCIFGKAKQKENKQGGTDLGTWTKMDIYEETGERVMYWENGQKCWNGPKRSATVHVTCGAETKLLSADEPDTCRYVFKMESHIACDEAFKQHMGL